MIRGRISFQIWLFCRSSRTKWYFK